MQCYTVSEHIHTNLLVGLCIRPMHACSRTEPTGCVRPHKSLCRQEATNGNRFQHSRSRAQAGLGRGRGGASLRITPHPPGGHTLCTCEKDGRERAARMSTIAKRHAPRQPSTSRFDDDGHEDYIGSAHAMLKCVTHLHHGCDSSYPKIPLQFEEYKPKSGQRPSPVKKQAAPLRAPAWWGGRGFTSAALCPSRPCIGHLPSNS